VKALRARVLDKIGMSRSELDIEVVEKDDNFDMSHGLNWKERSVLRDLSLEQFSRSVVPTGALWSTAKDMAKYIKA
jgi:CubicO group peptidase (beta-lactamase class C family)